MAHRGRLRREQRFRNGGRGPFACESRGAAGLADDSSFQVCSSIIIIIDVGSKQSCHQHAFQHTPIPNLGHQHAIPATPLVLLSPGPRLPRRRGFSQPGVSPSGRVRNARLADLFPAHHLKRGTILCFSVFCFGVVVLLIDWMIDWMGHL